MSAGCAYVPTPAEVAYMTELWKNSRAANEILIWYPRATSVGLVCVAPGDVRWAISVDSAKNLDEIPMRIEGMDVVLSVDIVEQ